MRAREVITVKATIVLLCTSSIIIGAVLLTSAVIFILGPGTGDEASLTHRARPIIPGKVKHILAARSITFPAQKELTTLLPPAIRRRRQLLSIKFKVTVKQDIKITQTLHHTINHTLIHNHTIVQTLWSNNTNLDINELYRDILEYQRNFYAKVEYPPYRPGKIIGFHSGPRTTTVVLCNSVLNGSLSASLKPLFNSEDSTKLLTKLLSPCRRFMRRLQVTHAGIAVAVIQILVALECLVFVMLNDICSLLGAPQLGYRFGPYNWENCRTSRVPWIFIIWTSFHLIVFIATLILIAQLLEVEEQLIQDIYRSGSFTDVVFRNFMANWNVPQMQFYLLMLTIDTIFCFLGIFIIILILALLRQKCLGPERAGPYTPFFLRVKAKRPSIKKFWNNPPPPISPSPQPPIMRPMDENNNNNSQVGSKLIVPTHEPSPVNSSQQVTSNTKNKPVTPSRSKRRPIEITVPPKKEPPPPPKGGSNPPHPPPSPTPPKKVTALPPHPPPKKVAALPPHPPPKKVAAPPPHPPPKKVAALPPHPPPKKVAAPPPHPPPSPPPPKKVAPPPKVVAAKNENKKINPKPKPMANSRQPSNQKVAQVQVKSQPVQSPPAHSSAGGQASKIPFGGRAQSQPPSKTNIASKSLNQLPSLAKLANSKQNVAIPPKPKPKPVVSSTTPSKSSIQKVKPKGTEKPFAYASKPESKRPMSAPVPPKPKNL